MAPHRLLTREEELELAREIERRDIGVWSLLLGDLPSVPFVVGIVDESLGDRPVETAGLLRAATAAHLRRGRGERRRFSAVAKRLARELRAADLDRELMGAVVKELRRAADRGAFERSDTGWSFHASSRRFAEHLARLNAELCAAARARRKFVESNLKLVFAVARKYESGPLSFLDLLQEGNLGLMKAVDRFDYRRGYRFSTYASWWIRNAISRAIADTGATVRLPSYLSERRRQVAKARSALRTELGREANSDEVAARLGIDIERFRRLEESLVQQEVSLDQPVNDEFDRVRGDVFRDPNAESRSPFDELSDRLTRERIDRLIARMSDVEANVLRQRYGLDGKPARTLQQIADQRGLSRERIRQIQDRALRNLRAAWRAQDRLRVAGKPRRRVTVRAGGQTKKSGNS